MKRFHNTSAPDWPADRVERRSLDALVLNPRNARTHSDSQIERIAASIHEWGWTSPVLVSEDGMVIAGHGRVRAAKKLGLAEVPVMFAAGWSKAQIKAYALADNRLALDAGWDEAMLAIEIGELQELGFDVDLTGFTDMEILALSADKNPGLTDPDETPEPPAEPVSRTGDLWLLGNHRLLCGDSTFRQDVGNALGSVKPHHMVTDLPYGVDYDPKWRADAGVNRNPHKMGKVANDNRADWREAWMLFPGSVAYVWHAGRCASTVQDSLIASGFDVRSQIIWAKDRFALSRGHYHWQHEPCWYAVRNGSSNWTGDRKQSTLWQIPARESRGLDHGTQKPVECMRRPIENNSSAGQAIYEPFSGTGSTIIAAEMTGRSCHAIELLPAYVDVAVKRWEAFTGETARHAETGQSFEVAAEARGIGSKA